MLTRLGWTLVLGWIAMVVVVSFLSGCAAVRAFTEGAGISEPRYFVDHGTGEVEEVTLEQIEAWQESGVTDVRGDGKPDAFLVQDDVGDTTKGILGLFGPAVEYVGLAILGAVSWFTRRPLKKAAKATAKKAGGIGATIGKAAKDVAVKLIKGLDEPAKKKK